MQSESSIRTLKDRLQSILMYQADDKNLEFLVSSLVEENDFNSTDDILNWMKEINSVQFFEVEQIPLADLRKWSFDSWTGDLRHESGGFFSIRGLRIRTNRGPVPEWSQPIIDQPEIGILGIVAKRFNGVLHFLMQAKAEPGNINSYQLSPTVQATRSNFLRLHGGKATLFLDYFTGQQKVKVLIDQLQSEQGARFYRKRNRNIIVQVDDDHEIENIPSNFRWVTLCQMKKLMLQDNTVNMDARSVLSNVDYNPSKVTSLNAVNRNDLQTCIADAGYEGEELDRIVRFLMSSHQNNYSLHVDDDILLRLASEKFKTDLEVRVIPLNEVEQWRRSQDAISHEEGKFFSIIGVRVAANSREVSSWDQPINHQVDPGIVAWLIQDIEGIPHFLVQLKLESGNMDLLEMAPTVQCITGSYHPSKQPSYVGDVLNVPDEQVLFDTQQSEEGGRFYQESNRNIAIQVGEHSIPLDPDDNYIWMNLRQLKSFIRFNNFLNVEARSLLAIL
ncbi:NDP-hexose 2,3-dehydratase family protein [bacterium]|nr:NDP-hexose 2,3-dehydratase family protein [bacterium]